MKAYTDNFTVHPDGIYRIERVYCPGGDWERRESTKELLPELWCEDGG